ncbi:hypothetical protein HXY33_04710 [Candidatus Bathyarchaeota archaeon]|nr:hypothetical protein [Candidatus Bathyarchaeota archaeon]
MTVELVKQWIKKEILRRGFDGTCGVASFSDVYNSLMPIQQKELEKVCGDNFKKFIDYGSIISIAVFHTENAIKTINVRRDGEVDYEKWNIYTDEYNRINNVLNEVCTKLASVLEGIPLRATSELGSQVQSVEEYYPAAKISHREVAEHAGIGARGKNELIVTKQNGCAVRFNSFITPKALEKGERTEDLCGDCRACLDSCRILQRKRELKDYRQQCLDRIKGLELRYSVCGICLRACYENGDWRKH